MRALSLALLTFTLASPALAEERREPPTTEERRLHLEARLDEVGATPEQRERILAITAASDERREAFKEEGSALKTRVRDLLWAAEIDRKGLERAREEAVDLFDRATTFALDAMVKTAEVLTPEQRLKVHERLAE